PAGGADDRPDGRAGRGDAGRRRGRAGPAVGLSARPGSGTGPGEEVACRAGSGGPREYLGVPSGLWYGECSIGLVCQPVYASGGPPPTWSTGRWTGHGTPEFSAGALSDPACVPCGVFGFSPHGRALGGTDGNDRHLEVPSAPSPASTNGSACLRFAWSVRTANRSGSFRSPMR